MYGEAGSTQDGSLRNPSCGGTAKSEDFVEPVPGRAASGRTRWLYPTGPPDAYARSLVNLLAFFHDQTKAWSFVIRTAGS